MKRQKENNIVDDGCLIIMLIPIALIFIGMLLVLLAI